MMRPDEVLITSKGLIFLCLILPDGGPGDSRQAILKQCMWRAAQRGLTHRILACVLNRLDIPEDWRAWADWLRANANREEDAAKVAQLLFMGGYLTGEDVSQVCAAFV